MVMELWEGETLVVLKVALNPLLQSNPMEMRDLLDRAGNFFALRAARGMRGKVKRAVWVDRMVAPLGRPTRIP